ncbi:galactose-1-epimerase, partial [Sinorhizobium meliloti]
NNHGMKVIILDRGAMIHSIRVPDRQGRMGEVTLGCNSVEAYEKSGAYFGAITGRYANRIARGQMTVAGEPVELVCNNGGNHLHGGNSGFDDKVWKTGFSYSEDCCTLTLTYTSQNGEEG